MAEMVIYLPTDRVFFGKGVQRTFLLEAIRRTAPTQRKFAEAVGVDCRTLTDWLREKYWLPYGAAVSISKLSRQKLPKIMEKRDRFWYARKGSVKGGLASYAKHRFGNNEAKRLAHWKKWWAAEGKNTSKIIGKKKPFTVPEKSADLAEFVGIVLGDGGITAYQCNITLNSDTDRDYSFYVENLIRRLFGVQARRYKKGASVLAENLSINRKGVVDFLVSIGLKKGNKLGQGIEIPRWVLADTEYRRACVRGLIDTDGCVIRETHAIKGKTYVYARINFTSASLPLAKSVLKIFNDENLKPKLRHGGRAVQLENKEKMWQYFKTIGTSNPKHLRRWQAIAGRDV